jgi:hypothetical protein
MLVDTNVTRVRFAHQPLWRMNFPPPPSAAHGRTGEWRTGSGPAFCTHSHNVGRTSSTAHTPARRLTLSRPPGSLRGADARPRLLEVRMLNGRKPPRYLRDVDD